MGKRLIPLALALLFVVFMAGCAEKPLEDARDLERNGFKTSYHQYLWTLLGTNEADGIVEATYSHTESDTFFAVVRISAQTAQAQNLTGPDAMETMMTTYVANYAGTNEKITSSDTDTEYVRELSFRYRDADVNADYTYLAKMVLNRQSGEVMILLAAHPNSVGGLIKDELALILDSAVLLEIAAA